MRVAYTITIQVVNDFDNEIIEGVDKADLHKEIINYIDCLHYPTISEMVNTYDFDVEYEIDDVEINEL